MPYQFQNGISLLVLRFSDIFHRDWINQLNQNEASSDIQNINAKRPILMNSVHSTQERKFTKKFGMFTVADF